MPGLTRVLGLDSVHVLGDFQARLAMTTWSVALMPSLLSNKLGPSLYYVVIRTVVMNSPRTVEAQVRVVNSTCADRSLAITDEQRLNYADALLVHMTGHPH